MQVSNKALSYRNFFLGCKITMLQTMNAIVRLQSNTSEGIAPLGVLGKTPNQTAKPVGRQRGVCFPLNEKGKDARAHV